MSLIMLQLHRMEGMMKIKKSFNELFTEASNKYDDTNYIYNAADDGIYTEQELKKKFTAQDNYKLLKSVANNQEKKQFRDIERKYKKKSSIDQRTKPFNKKPDTGGAVKIDIAALPKINPFENTITHTYGAIEDVPIESEMQLDANVFRRALNIKPKERKSTGLAYLLGVDDE